MCRAIAGAFPATSSPPGYRRAGGFGLVARNATTLQNVSADSAVSLTLRGQAPALNVQMMYPNGGEALTLNQPVTIRWTTSGNAVSHGIRLSKDGGTTFPIEIASGLGGSEQSYTWTPTADMITGQGRLQIEDRDSAGAVKTAQSASDFNIIAETALTTLTITSITPNRSRLDVRTPITVTGDGFSDGCTLWIGDREAKNLVRESSTRLTADAPSMSASVVVDVTVMNPDRQSFTLKGGFSYGDLVISEVTPNAGPAELEPDEQPQRVVINGLFFKDKPTVMFGQQASPDVTFVDDKQIKAVVPTPARKPGITVKVMVMNPDGETAELLDAFTYLGEKAQQRARVTRVEPQSIVASGNADLEVTLYGFNLIKASTTGTVAFRYATRLEITEPKVVSRDYDPEGKQDIVKLQFKVTAGLSALERAVIQVCVSVRPGAGGDGIFDSMDKMFGYFPADLPTAVVFTASLPKAGEARCSWSEQIWRMRPSICNMTADRPSRLRTSAVKTG